MKKHYFKKARITKVIATVSFVCIQLSGFAQIQTGTPSSIKPSGGDDVCDATILKTGLACTEYSNDTSTASSTIAPPCWADGVAKDVWFSFIATSQDMTISTDAIIFELIKGTSNNDTEIALYKSNDGTCNNISLEGCDQDSGINSGADLATGNSGPTRQALLEKTGLIPGKTYYIRVQGQGIDPTTNKPWIGNFCLSAFDTYTVGSKPCEAQAIHPNNSVCDKYNGNAVVNTTSNPAGGAMMVNTLQSGAYVPLGQTWAGSPALATQYGTWTTFDGNAAGGDITVSNQSGNAVDYTLFSGDCTGPVFITSKPCAVGGSVNFTGITTGTKYYVLTTLQGGDTNPVVKTDLCITNAVIRVHPETEKNLGGVAGAGGTAQADHFPAFEIVADQVYKTTTYAADKDGAASCAFGRNVWFTWKVPSTYPKDANGNSMAYFQMWNKNCTSGPGSIGTRLIFGASILGDISTGACIEFSSPSQTGAAGSSGDLDPYTDAATNVGFNPQAYGKQYWAMFQSGNDGSGDSKEVCDFNFMIGSTPSIKGISIPDTTISIGKSATLKASGGLSYLWSTGETTNSITVSPTVNTSYTVTSTSGADGYAVGYVKVNSLTSITKNSAKLVASVNINPNPTSGNFNVTVNSGNLSSVTITVVTLTGQSLLVTTQQNNNGIVQIPVDLSNFSSGIYFLKIQVGDELITKKVVLNK